MKPINYDYKPRRFEGPQATLHQDFVAEVIATLKKTPGQWYEVRSWISSGPAAAWLERTQAAGFYGEDAAGCIFRIDRVDGLVRIVACYKPEAK